MASKRPTDRGKSTGFRPYYIFVYGTLMDPAQLRRVLHLRDSPKLEPASITGWKIMLWGQYPTLVSTENNVVKGLVYEILKARHLDYLKEYETKAYRVQDCSIKLADEREVQGKTFVFNGEEDYLKEGSFDLKDWRLKQSELS